MTSPTTGECAICGHTAHLLGCSAFINKTGDWCPCSAPAPISPADKTAVGGAAGAPSLAERLANRVRQPVDLSEVGSPHLQEDVPPADVAAVAPPKEATQPALTEEQCRAAIVGAVCAELVADDIENERSTSAQAHATAQGYRADAAILRALANKAQP